MRRFKVTPADGRALLLYYPTEAGARRAHPGAAVEEYVDPTLTENIELIKSKSERLSEAAGRSYYRMFHPDGVVYLKLSRDIADGAFYDIVRYQQHKLGAFAVPVAWDVDTVQGFVEKFILRKPLTFELISHRRYGEPKLSKPDALRGVPQSFSVPMNHKCSCPCFADGNDLWIKCRDYFSTPWRPPADDLGKPTSYYMQKYFNARVPEKFIYTDTWGEIILRDEAWIKLSNLFPTLPFLAPPQIARRLWSQMCAHHHWPADTQNPEWTRFLESAATAALEYSENKEEPNAPPK